MGGEKFSERSTKALELPPGHCKTLQITQNIQEQFKNSFS